MEAMASHQSAMCHLQRVSLLSIKGPWRGIAWLWNVSKEPPSPGLRGADGDALIQLYWMGDNVSEHLQQHIAQHVLNKTHERLDWQA
jgi:hypothetical protein